MRPQCPDEGILQSYVDGELNGPEMEMTSLHLNGCPVCQQSAHRIAAEDEWLIPILNQNSAYIFNNMSMKPLTIPGAVRNGISTAALSLLALAATLLLSLVGPWILASLANSLSTVGWLAREPIATVIWTYVLRAITDSTYFHGVQTGLVITGAFWASLFIVFLYWQSYWRRKNAQLKLN